MNPLDSLLLLGALTALPGLLAPRHRLVGLLTSIGFLLQLLLLLSLLPQIADAKALLSSLQFELLDHRLEWQLNGLGWFFAVITAGAALIAAAFASAEWAAYQPRAGRLQGVLALNVLAMYLLLTSADLLSLFVGWELVSWAGFLLMALPGGVAAKAAFRYLVYALGGAMALLAAIVLVEVKSGSLLIATVGSTLAGLPLAELWPILLLFIVGFAVKMGLLPFHLWQAPAYGETDGPAAAFLGAIASRMGLFGLLLVIFQLVGLDRLIEVAVPFTFWSGRDLLAWIAALTLIIPTFIALTQNDARLLLAWHGIGQGGYMLLGLLTLEPLGTAGGLLHVLNHASYQAPLFLAVTAVVYRTGTADLDKLGGLITRMPLAYVTLLLGIIGLAGLPPMNGFVSKWLVYKGLLDADMPLLFVAAVIGTLGTILSVYKLIHNIFLGQLRAEHREVTDAPWSMTGPMLLLAGFAFLTGVLPGLGLMLVAPAAQSLGLAMPTFNLAGITAPSGSLDMLVVVAALFSAIGFGALVFLNAGRSHRTHQLDNYAGGHFLTSTNRYQYSHNFYAGLLRLIGPWMQERVVKLERGLVQFTELLAGTAHGLYRAEATLGLLLGTAFVLMWLGVLL